MRQCRLLATVILAVAVFSSGILLVERAAAQGGYSRTPPPVKIAPSTPITPMPEPGFDTDWHQAAGRLSGCVYSRHAALADNVRVGIEGLDASGAVVGKTSTWVGNVPASSYGHFEFPALAGASSYRIKVVSAEFVQAR